MRKQSAAGVEITIRDKKNINKRNEGTSNPSTKKAVLWINQREQVEQQVTPPIKIIMWTYYNGVKQSVVKRKILSVA